MEEKAANHQQMTLIRNDMDKIAFNRQSQRLSVFINCPKQYGQPVWLIKCKKCIYHSGIDEDGIYCQFKKKEPTIHPENILNELSGNEWLFFSKSVLQTSYRLEYGFDLRKAHGANKPPQLMKHIIEFFTKPGQLILDPFAGVGGTLIGASLCRRKAIGIEINNKWIAIYHKVCERENIVKQEMILGDCTEHLKKFIDEKREFDFIATDPPYSIALNKTLCDGKYGWKNRKTGLNGFSDDERDFRNLKTFSEYYDAMENVAKQMYKILKWKGYLAMVIRDSYQNGEYIIAAYELAERIKRAGFILKGIKIWYGTGSPIRPYGYPIAYVPNIVHQNILIFRKDTPKAHTWKVSI